MTARLALLIVSVIVVYGCSNPTSPKNNQNTPVATVSVGSSGGSVETGDVSLVVPQGAFSEERTLKVFVSAEQSTSQEQVTKNYEISGLPQVFSKPLHMRLKYSGSLSGKNFIVVGGSYFFSTPGKENSIYAYLPAADSSGYLVADVPPMAAYSIAGKRSDYTPFPENVIFFVMGLTGHDGMWTEQGHFSLIYPYGMKTHAAQLGKTLEDIYAFYTSEGYDFKVRDMYFSVDRIKIHISKNADESEPVENSIDFGSSSESEEHRFEMFINEKDFQTMTPEAIKAAFGSAFFGFLLHASDSRYTIKGQQVVREGARIWSEGMFTSDKNHIPKDFIGNEGAPFDGLRGEIYDGSKDDWKKVRAYSRGMSAFFQYLCDESRYGRKLMPKILREIREGIFSIQAVANAAGESFEVLWPGFIKEYVSGKVYGVSSDVILKNVRETWVIRSKADSLRVFSDDYSGLSAKLFRIDLNHADIDSSSSLTFTLNKTGSEIQVFTLKNGVLEFQGRGGELMLTHIRDLAREGYSLLAVVTYSTVFDDPAETTPVTLTVEAKQPKQVQLSGYNRCIVRMDNLNCLYSNGNEWEVSTFKWGDIRGSFDNYTFTAHSDTTIYSEWSSSSQRYTISVKIDLDISLTRAVYFSAEYTNVFSSASTKTIYSYSISGNDVPFHNENPYSTMLIYEAYGSEARNNVKRFNLTAHVNNSVSNEVTRYEFKDDTRLFINIWQSPQ